MGNLAVRKINSIGKHYYRYCMHVFYTLLQPNIRLLESASVNVIEFLMNHLSCYFY